MARKRLKSLAQTSSNNDSLNNWPKAFKTRKFVGAHVSIAGGLHNSPMRCASIGGCAFALFLKSSRTWKFSPITDEAIFAFKNACTEYNFDPALHVLPHGSYLVNLANPSLDMQTKAFDTFLDDLKRCDALGIRYFNFHPGNAVAGTNTDEAIDRVCQAMNRAIGETRHVVLVIENMAGAGNVLGSTFEQLKAMLDRIEQKHRVGICLDTCHLFAAGYDIRTRQAYDLTMARFNDVVGFDYLKGVHLNDSKGGLGCKKDRHENIGKGLIGIDAFRFLMNDNRFNDIPMVLETPLGKDDDPLVRKHEIDLLYGLIDSSNNGKSTY